jgi:putative SOS response-associated peptidase YedK
MCGRYGRLSRFERIAEFMHGGLRNATGELKPKYNVAPGTVQPVMRMDDQGAVLTPMKWGLVPFWAKDSNTGVRPVNAKSATAHEKPMFRKLIRERRCLVPVDWFYEWREAPPADKAPFVIRMASQEPFFMGGLWDTWHAGANDELTTFTVLTTEPNELMQTLHHRMPVIIAPSDASRWLDATVGDIDALMKPFSAEAMTAYAVGKRVNSSRNEGPDLIEPVAA